MKIKNNSLIARFCEDKLLQPQEEFSTEEEKYISAAKISPEIFELEMDLEPEYEKKQKVKKHDSN
jgi:hypothetical protein